MEGITKINRKLLNARLFVYNLIHDKVYKYSYYQYEIVIIKKFRLIPVEIFQTDVINFINF